MPRIKSYNDASVSCPFYHGDDGKLVIQCEGPMDNGTNMLRFFTKSEFDKYMEDYCMGDYDKCSIHSGNIKKYENGRIAKDDCVGFDKDHPERCTILTEQMCRTKGNCKFYKKK